ncbi:STAS/SEC14 domain-containing protein [Rubrivirga sp. IMCC45206]|uniref:STAS/SEC14 domain-containing protein n=1 Tax=Rubrivirga sp. IMCC45206 TaxID=3391614 RepID=UPI00398FF4BB
MFRLLPDLPPHVVGFVLDGTVTRPDVDALFREVEGAMARGHVHLVGEITGVGGLTLDALGAQFARSFGLLSKLGKVDRYAVVTDTGWIEALATAQGAFLPGLDVQVWPRAERDDAVAWASEPLAP